MLLQWQAAYDELAEYVYENEPNTISYYFGVPMEHAHAPSRTDSMFAFESYASRSDLYDVHLKSGPMNKFLSTAVPDMTTGLDLVHFRPVGGFLDRSGKKTQCGVMHDVQIRCHDGEARAKMLEELTKLCSQVEEKQGAPGKDGEVLSFIGLVCLDNDTGARIFARYQSREVWEAWQRNPLIQRFWADVKPYVASMSSRPFVPNGKGWLWK